MSSCLPRQLFAQALDALDHHEPHFFNEEQTQEICIIRPIPVQFPEVLQGTSEA